MKRIICIIIIVFVSQWLVSSNVMKIGSYEAQLNDTVIVELEIVNDDAFISFQCDILFDETLEYVEGSATLTNRSDNHVLIDAELGSSGIRFLSYSNINDEFLENEGAVLEFKIVTGNATGNYPLELINAIIGDANSQNILTDSINGNIHIFSPGISEHEEFQSFRVFPNPLNLDSKVVFRTKETVEITIQIIGMNGSILHSSDIGIFKPGSYEYQLQDLFHLNKLNNNVLIRLIGFTRDNRITVSIINATVVKT